MQVIDVVFVPIRNRMSGVIGVSPVIVVVPGVATQSPAHGAQTPASAPEDPDRASPSPSMVPALRRISARAMCPVTMATMLAIQGSTVQPRMPVTRLAMARLLVRMLLFIGNSLQRSNLMPCASGSESE